MGALGIMYGYFLSKSLKDIKLTFVADRERQKIYEKEGIFFNDKRQDFHFMAPDESPRSRPNFSFSPSRARPSTGPSRTPGTR